MPYQEGGTEATGSQVWGINENPSNPNTEKRETGDL
jgi:hypothetical protein